MSVYDDTTEYKDLVFGASRTKNVSAHTCEVTALAATAFNTGRRLYRVVCHSCAVEISMGTTGPDSMIESHVRLDEHRLAPFSTHVIILAQGQQTRLPALKMAKQLLRLPVCNDVPIIMRTLCQLATLGHTIITVVCAGDLKQTLGLGTTGDVLRQTGMLPSLSLYELGDPGNSSLKGLQRYLDTQIDGGLICADPAFQTTVLLGDVAYSWHCLQSILSVNGQRRNMAFVGTPDLSRSGGELWGLSWNAQSHGFIQLAMRNALLKHPPFDDTYQPGQMRRLLWSVNELLAPGWDHGDFRPVWYQPVADYTRDIDLPEHVDGLEYLSMRAAADDLEHGLDWNKGVPEW